MRSASVALLLSLAVGLGAGVQPAARPLPGRPQRHQVGHGRTQTCITPRQLHGQLQSLRTRRGVAPCDLLEEFVFDTTRQFGGAPGGQEYCDVAVGGTNYLAVWQDYYRGSIVAARTTLDGALLDSFGIRVSPESSYGANPSVAFDGANYLVVWTSLDTMVWEADIYATRITPSGTVLDPQGIPVSHAPFDQIMPSVGFNGTGYLITWNDYSGGSTEGDVYAARMTPAGQVLDTAGIAISTLPGDQGTWHGVSFDGANWLVGWFSDPDTDRVYDVHASRISQSGTVLDTAGIPVSTGTWDELLATTAFDGANYLVTWTDGRTSDYRIYGARLTPVGVVLDTGGIEITPFSGAYSDLAFDGTNYLVIWMDMRSGEESDIYGARVTPAGTVLDSAGIPVSLAISNQWLPRVCCGNQRYIVGWSDYRGADSDPYVARVTPQGTVLDPDGILLAYGYSSSQQESPAAAFDGTNYLCVWQSWLGSQYYVQGARVTPQGTVLDPQPIRISPPGPGPASPAVAFDGANYLVVRECVIDSSPDIYGTLVSPSGIVLDTAGFPIAASGFAEMSPELAFDGTNYLVVWSFADWYNGKYEVRGARVSPSGTVLGQVNVTSIQGTQERPAIAFNGTNYLVAWNDDRDTNYQTTVFAARVTPQGTVLDPLGIEICPLEGTHQNPTVASDGQDWFVAFEDDRDSDYVTDICGARVSASGVVQDTEGIAISTESETQILPSAAYSNPNWVLAWQDFRNFGSDIYGARVTRSGVVLDPNGQELINNYYDRGTPGLTADSRLLVFAGSVEELGADKTLGAFWSTGGVSEQMPQQRGRARLRLLSNPLRGSGQVELSLPYESGIRLDLLDITGRRVATCISGRCPAGCHRLTLSGRGMAAGVYMLELKAGTERTVTRAVLLN